MAKIAHREPTPWDSWPLLGAMQRRAYERHFQSYEAAGCFRGVFPSSQAAAASAPSTQALGYDNPASARMYSDRVRQLYPSDYPVCFWMDRLFREGVSSVFDVGGHIGVAYYGYQPVLSFPERLSWMVFDVPAVVERGRARARDQDPSGRLSFTADFADCDGRELLFASGSLQYLEKSMAELLAGLKKPPRYLLVNHLPVHPTQTFFTLQNIGTAYCPYRIISDAEALAGLAELGYELRDRWENAEKSCFVPFHPEQSLDHYHGYFMERLTSGTPTARPRLIRSGALDGGRASSSSST